ncbi:MAG: FAD-dependent oxidoreductase [Planctomycetota bacterium]
MKTAPSSPETIAIVGAGVAGLTAAVELARGGLAVQVFDKGRGVSGRVSTRWAEDRRFDHGAQYFTARDERFAQRVAGWVEAGAAAEWRGEIRAIGCDAPTAKTRYVGVPGMNAIGQALAAEAQSLGAQVTTGVRVTPPKPADGRLRLVADSGETLADYDRVLVTAPPPQAAELLVASPALANAAKSVRTTGCWAAMVVFADPLDTGFDGAFVGDSPLSWIARNGSKPGRPSGGDIGDCWVLHGSPEWSEANIERDAADVADDLLAAMFKAIDLPARTPSLLSAHRWRFALPENPLTERSPADPDRRLYAAGDWCGGPRVEGAFLSGLCAGERILADAAAR